MHGVRAEITNLEMYARYSGEEVTPEISALSQECEAGKAPRRLRSC